MIEVIEGVQGQPEQLGKVLLQSKICKWTDDGTHW